MLKGAGTWQSRETGRRILERKEGTPESKGNKRTKETHDNHIFYNDTPEFANNSPLSVISHYTEHPVHDRHKYFSN